MMGSYEKSILKTLCYSAVFKYPLTKAELWRYLIWEKKSPPRFSQFNKALNLLDESRFVVGKDDSFYQLKMGKDWVRQRKLRTKIAKRKISIAKRVCQILSIIPTIELIGLSGSLSLGVGERNDDIDLLIICKKNSLWATRLIVNLQLIFLGIKRNPDDKDIKDKICVNMFMESHNLKIPFSEQDLYAVHEFAFLKPLFKRNNTYQKLIDSNKWIKKYLPNAFIFSHAVNKFDNKIFLIYFFDKIAQKIQLIYMKKRKTTEVIKKGYVRFHPKDARSWILPEYNRLVNKYLILNSKL